MKLKKDAVIGIIGAKKIEVDLFARNMTDVVAETVGMQTFITGNLDGHPAVVAVAGIGKVNAAVCATTMILRYSPGIVINTGVAGALDPALDVGDTAVADAAIEHDLDYGVIGDPRGIIFYPDGTSGIVIPTDREVADGLYAAAEDAGLHVLRGTVASGDIFVSYPETKAAIRAQFGDDVRVCEMEGAAIVHVCRLFGVRCGVLRSVSDRADGSAETDYYKFVESSARVAAGVLRRFISSL